ncbi:MAG: EcoKI restriction-modification system protein HsdS [Planctomycetes bacterium ADurb.Bin401]|nr:MAG: EcoKI restriction-modification system protein HsdS [Planctomycetes bacterium ADurb.Bin401]HNY51341.1 restriction endonuclease subunit S [Smithella sp.]HQO14457.1 restriction endonuclease subunit S [Smithellaceae bacterium]HOG90704.1 restriction endonuclease subunit S [Smithella sp.]HOU51214.1 restriction endonuclease subunit S [Smithella sp.]
MNIQSYKLPTDWQIEAIKDAYRFTKKPRNLDAKENSEIPFIPMELIPLGKLFVDNWVMKPTKKLGSGTYFENGDLLVAKITPSFENGKQAIAKINCSFGYATTEVIPIQEIEGTSDKFYLHFILLHPGIRKELAEKMDGSTGRQRLSKEILGSKKIPLPPHKEQQRIAYVLSMVQTAIEQQERLIKITRELKSALMHKLFTEGLRGEKQKMTEIGPVPESWEIGAIRDIAQVKGGKRLPKGDKLVEYKTNYPYLRVTDFEENSVNVAGLKYLLPETQQRIRRYIISDKDVFISIAGTIGLTGMIPVELNGANLTENAAKIVLRTDKLISRFLMYYLSTDNSQKEIHSQTVKNAQPKLALSRIESLKIPIPSKDEQEEIVNILDTLRQRVILIQRKRFSLEELFRTLLHQLMTGQTRVNEIDLSGFK